MMKLLKSLTFGLLLFGMAGAGSWFMMNRPDPAAADPDSGQEPAAAAPTQDPTDPEAPPKLSDVPVPVRAKSATAEEIFRLGAALRRQQEALGQREEALQQKELQLKLVHEDVRNQQRELEGLLAQIQDALKSGEALKSNILQAREQLEQRRSEAQHQLQQMDKAESQRDESQSANIKKMSQIIQNMPVDGASAYLRQAIDAGNMDSAVQVLANLEERDAAEVLHALGDPVLIAQLMDGLQNMKRPSSPRRR